VRDKKTGDDYVELFFRPLEEHAGSLYNTLVAPPPDETNGKWAIVRGAEDVPPSELRLGDVVAVRRGPSGLLIWWGGDGEFGTARVVADARQINTDPSG